MINYIPGPDPEACRAEAPPGPNPFPALGDDLTSDHGLEREIRAPGETHPRTGMYTPILAQQRTEFRCRSKGDASRRIYCAFLAAAAIFASLRRLRASGKASVSSILSHHLKLDE